MANLQVRDINEKLCNSLRRKAELEHRSISQGVLHIIENHIQAENHSAENSTLEFLKLSGSWEDKRSTDKII